MADTVTPNIGFVKPEVGASANTWGEKTNANWDKADTAVNAKQAKSEKGVAGGYASLDADIKVPLVQMNPAVLNSGVVSGAPANLDTLQKLAAAIGNDPNFTASVAAALLTKLTAADFTGAAAKPTPVDADTIPLMDSADGNKFKKLSWANLKTMLAALYYGKSEVYTKTEADTALNNKVAGQMSGSAYPRRSDGETISIQWSGQGGQPTWLLGSNDGVTWQVWNPGGFNVYAVGGWSQPFLESKFNYCVTDSRIAGFTSIAGIGVKEMPSGYFMTSYNTNSNGSVLGMSGRQPQIHIPAIGWRALGGW